MSLMGYFHIGQKQGKYEITRLITLYYCHKLTQGHPYRTCFSYTGLHSRSLMPMTMIKQHLTGAGICVASGNTRVIESWLLINVLFSLTIHRPFLFFVLGLITVTYIHLVV